MTLLLLHRLCTEWPRFYSGCLLNDPIFWGVHILPDRPLLSTSHLTEYYRKISPLISP